MKYLITGITGFVGPHLAKLLLEKDHEVWGISKNKIEDINMRETLTNEEISKIKIIYCDLTAREYVINLVKNNKFDGIFHLAAQSDIPTSFKEPKKTFQINANSSVYLAQALVDYQPECKMMLASSSVVYGTVSKEKGSINETMELNPETPYAVSKAAAELFILERAHSMKSPFFVTRSFSMTGPGRPNNFSISSDAYQIARIKANKQEPIINVGNLKSARTVIDVRDAVKAYYLLMQNFKSGEIYNVGGDDIYTIGELLDMMLEIKGVKAEKKTDESKLRKIDSPVQKGDNKKLKNLTGWERTISIKDTLKDLLAYHKLKIEKED